MAQELSDWIAPWVDNHYTQHGTDLGREYQDGRRVQIIRFETWRDPNNPQDKKQIIALGTDKVHCVRLVFDSDATDRYSERRGPLKPMTADLRSIYRLKSYRLSLPLLKSTRSPFLEIYVKDWDWWCGATSEIQFCENPIDMKIPLEMDEQARHHRDRKESRDRDFNNEDSANGTGMARREIDVFEPFRQGGMGKTTEAVRKDARAALAILWQAHRGVPQTGTVQVAPALSDDANVNVSINSGAHVDQDQNRAQDQIDPGMDVDDDDEESPPNRNSYEAPLFQIPPNPSLSNPDPTPTSSPSSSSPDPIVEKLRAGGSTPMELYELLVQRQLEGKNVDWAFRPARSLGGEAGLTKILDGITVFGLNLDEELDDSDGETETGRPVADTRRPPLPTKEVADSSRAGRMMRMRPALSDDVDEDADGDGDEADDGVETEVIDEESSDDDQDGNSNQNADKVGDQDEVEGEDETMVTATPASSTLPKRERSPTYEWSLSPPEPKKITKEAELDPEGEGRQAGPLPETTTVAIAEEVDDMLMIPANETPERVPIEQGRPAHAATRIAASPELPTNLATERRSTTPKQNDLPDPPRATALTTPKRRPNVKRIRLDTPSSDEGESLPSVLGKRKASLASTPPTEQSERESKRFQKIKKLKLLEEQMKKIQASIDVDDEGEEDLDVVKEPSRVPEEPNVPSIEATTEDLPKSGLGTLACNEAAPLPTTSESDNKPDNQYKSPPSNAVGEKIPCAVPELPQRPISNQPVPHEGLTVGEVVAIGKDFRAFLQQARR